MPRLTHLACAVALALASSAAFAQSAPPSAQPSTHAGLFDQMVMFGDSLSDGGNIALSQGLPILRWTTNPGLTAVENIGAYLGVPMTPSLARGTDFAFGGAGLVNNSPGTPAGIPTLPTQMGMYLTAGGGKADPNALYGVWGGANDIFYAATAAGAAAAAQAQIEALVPGAVQQTIAGMVQAWVAADPTARNNPTAIAQYEAAITPTVTQQVTQSVTQQVVAAAEAQAGVTTLMDAQQAQAAIQNAAMTELGMIQQLGKAGARYVMVFNLPNIGITPDAAQEGPAAAQALTGLTLTFNNTLNSGLAKTGVNVIPVNTFAMLNELIADPSRFGFTNVTTPACTGSALACLPAGTPGAASTYQPGTNQTYLFADGVHPTTAAHAMLAQYAESIITAPGAMSLLAEAPLQVNESANRSILNQATTGLAQAPGNGLRVWASYDYAHQRVDAQVNSPKTDNNLNTLSFGAGIHPSDAVTAGLAFTAGQQRDDFAGNAGGFKLRELLASGYVLWGWDQAYFGAIGSFGHLTYSNIHRNIPIGPAVLFESGSTSGSHSAFALTGGWWFNLGSWRTGPYADVSWQHIHVDSFADNGDDAAAMTFGRQDRHALIGTLGWQLSGNLTAGSTALHPFARVAWNHDDDADPRAVSGGLVTMPGTFALPGFAPDANWGSVGVGLAADFTPKFSGWIGYDGRFSDSSQRIDSLNIGAKLRF
ncbi:MAG: autotransporter domain-containing protein [Rhodanobacteraceae bacterium]|nr:MAG: autotransporter domain-containing protein [Rhodanobacteraceae bacterium]